MEIYSRYDKGGGGVLVQTWLSVLRSQYVTGSLSRIKKKKSVFFINHNEIRRRREIYVIRDVREIIYSAITYHDFIWIDDHQFF